MYLKGIICSFYWTYLFCFNTEIQKHQENVKLKISICFNTFKITIHFKPKNNIHIAYQLKFVRDYEYCKNMVLLFNYGTLKKIKLVYKFISNLMDYKLKIFQ